MTAAYATDAKTQPFDASLKKYQEMVSFLQSSPSLAMQHEELEDYVRQQGRDLLRRMVQGHLDVRAMAEQTVTVRGAEGIERSQERKGTHRKLRLVFGDVEVTRRLYQADGVAGLAPMDAALNLPQELYSFGMRKLVAREVACNSYDHAVSQIALHCTMPIGKRQVEQLAVRAAEDFEAFYEEHHQCRVDPSHFLVLTFDGASIRVRDKDLREATRKKRAQAKDMPEQWPPPKGSTKKSAKRRVMVAATYDVAAFPRTPMDIVRDLRPVQDTDKLQRPRPVNKRVWASVEYDCARAVDDAFTYALQRDPEKRRTWVALTDGDEHQIECIRQRARELGVNVVIILDVIHVLGYIWGAAHCFHKKRSKEAEKWVMSRLAKLLDGADPSQVAAGMRRSATRQQLVNRDGVDKCAKYLINHRDIMAYNKALRAGMPIATGVIEGACRYVVRDRMDKTGATWSVAGAEAVLRLRALQTNGDFDAYWAFHTATEYRMNHAGKYANAIPPSPIPSSPRPQLRVAK